MHQIHETCARLARESHMQVTQFEALPSETWDDEDRVLYRFSVQGAMAGLDQLCHALDDENPLLQVEQLTMQGASSEYSEGIGAEIILQICAEYCVRESVPANQESTPTPSGR